MSDEQPLLVEDRGPIRILTINRKPVHNKLTVAVLDHLLQALEEASNTSTVRGLVLAGEGTRAFVVGPDLEELSKMSDVDAAGYVDKGQSVCAHLESLEIPTIAAVEGLALSVGLELALACDFIYASENAHFGMTEVKLAATPAFGGLHRLRQRVGLSKALELAMTGDFISAAEAHRIGLVAKILEPETVVDHAVHVANATADNGPLAVRGTKHLLRQYDGMSVGDRLKQEKELFLQTFASSDRKEGIEASLTNRPANYKGQ